MMKPITRALAPITALLLAASAAGTPFDPALVEADARWIAHIDMDRARDAGGLRRLIRGDMDLKEADVGRLQRMLGVDISGLDADDFSFICAYGSGDGHSETAVIGASPGAIDWFASWMSRDGEAQDDVQAQEWTVRSWRRHGRLTAMTTMQLPGGRSAMIIADSTEEVVAGARVIAGEAPSLAAAGGGGAALTARPRPGSIIFLAAEGIDEFKALRPKAVVLREAKRLTLDFGEHDDQLFLAGRVSAASPEQAAATRDLLSGLRAWGRMAITQSGRAGQLAEMLDTLTLRVDGADVIVSWSAEISSLPAPREPATEPATAQPEAQPPR